MKWFKHYSDSLDDPFIQALFDKFSHLGYVAYFGLIEIISKENGRNITGKLSVSPTYLRRKLRSSQGKLRQVFEVCQTFGKLSVTFSEEKWEFELCKMLEIKDNYTKDLQVACKKPSLDKEVRVKNKNKEEDNTSLSNDKGPVQPSLWDIGVKAGIQRSLIGLAVKTHGEEKTADIIAVASFKADPPSYFAAATKKRKLKVAV